MEMKEPIIYAGEMSTEEIHQWMKNKLHVQAALRNLEFERASLQERLNVVCADIEALTSQGQLTTFQLSPGPTQIQGDQQKSPDIG